MWDRAKYERYLQSPGWKRRAAAARKYAEGRCQLCNAGGELNVHHRTYERLGCEQPADLTVLCRAHHEQFHGVTDDRPSRAQVPTAEAEDQDQRVQELVGVLRAAGEEQRRLAKQQATYWIDVDLSDGRGSRLPPAVCMALHQLAKESDRYPQSTFGDLLVSGADLERLGLPIPSRGDEPKYEDRT